MFSGVALVILFETTDIYQGWISLIATRYSFGRLWFLSHHPVVSYALFSPALLESQNKSGTPICQRSDQILMPTLNFQTISADTTWLGIPPRKPCWMYFEDSSCSGNNFPFLTACLRSWKEAPKRKRLAENICWISAAPQPKPIPAVATQ